MSRIFDVIGAGTKAVSIASAWAGQHMRMKRLCYPGPNRFLMPQFVGNPAGVEYSSDAENYKKADEVGDRNATERHHFKINYSSPEVTSLHAVVRRFTELSTLGSPVGGTVVLEPLALQKTNYSTYYVRLKAQCPRHAQVTIVFGDGGEFEFVGEVEFYSTDPRILNMRVHMPANAKLEASYSQILKVRDSIISKLQRMHYGKDPFQPKVV